MQQEFFFINFIKASKILVALFNILNMLILIALSLNDLLMFSLTNPAYMDVGLFHLVLCCCHLCCEKLAKLQNMDDCWKLRKIDHKKNL